MKIESSEFEDGRVYFKQFAAEKVNSINISKHITNYKHKFAQTKIRTRHSLESNWFIFLQNDSLLIYQDFKYIFYTMKKFL